MSPARQDAHGRYENPDGRQPRGFLDILRWKLRLGPRETPGRFPGANAQPYQPDLATPDLTRIRAPEPGRIQATWVGHSTWLLQIGGLNLLTDPHWSERASPVSWAGPKRIAPPALRFEELPHVDVVLLSHNHYDHLDRATMRRIVAGWGRSRASGSSTDLGHRLFVPMGLGGWCQQQGAEPVMEANWGQEIIHGQHVFRCVPAQHWSSRTPFDRRRSLWCGWIIEAAGKKIYFAGDTGLAEGMFEEIGREHGPFDLALLPIGAYAPRWFMADQHADPRDAVRIHRAVRSRRSLGMHWGTFVLTDEPPAEPPQRLARAGQEAQLPEADFRPARLGETVVI